MSKIPMRYPTMTKRHAFIVCRVIARLHEQAERAVIYGRERDAYAIHRIIGRIEAAVFGFQVFVNTEAE